MQNLYSKIYEAINTGIQKALVLPDEITDDISVRFHHKKLSNDIDIMADYVRNLLDGDDSIYYYGQILKYYEKTHKKYKVNDFNELANIFNKIGYVEHLNISWIDMSYAILIILDNGLEIPFVQLNPDIHTAKFIKLKNNITGHDIILHKDLLSKKCGWVKKDVEESDFNDIGCINMEKYGSYDKATQIADQDYNGYEHTYNNADIVSNKRDIDNYPAFKYCIKDLKDIDQKYKAYLPSRGELRFLYDNQDLINYILEKVKGEKINFNNYIWSSTEYSDYGTWYLGNGTTNYNFKAYSYTVLPIFTLKQI